LPHTTCRYVVLPAILSLTVIPTGLVAYVAYYVNRPEYTAEIASEMSRRLGVRTELREIAFPYPGIIEYRGLALHDALGTKLRAARLRVRRAGKRWHVEAESVNVALPATALPQPSGGERTKVAFARVGPRNRGNPLARLLRQFPMSAGGSVVLSVSNLAVQTAQGTFAVDRATMCFQLDPSGRPHLAGQFRLADAKRTVPVTFELVFRGNEPGVDAFRLNTRSAELPLRLASPVAPVHQWVGDDARLQGEVFAKRTARDWELSVRGRIAQLDLHRLTRHGLPFHLSGTADWSIDRARWKDGQLAELRGRVRAGPGRVSTELLRALARDAGFLVSLRVPARGTVAYERMAFAFSLEGGAVRLEGSCDDAIENLVMVGEHGEPLLQGPLGSTSMLGFARALSQSQHPKAVIPAGFDGAALMQILPPSPSRNAQADP
jgi:hypothetical protein